MVKDYKKSNSKKPEILKEDAAIYEALNDENLTDLEKQLIEGYIANAKEDLRIAKEWEYAENECWPDWGGDDRYEDFQK